MRPKPAIAIPSAVAGSLLALLLPAVLRGEDFEKIRATSAGKKFAMPIAGDAMPEDPENIDSVLITSVFDNFCGDSVGIER